MRDIPIETPSFKNVVNFDHHDDDMHAMAPVLRKSASDGPQPPPRPFRPRDYFGDARDLSDEQKIQQPLDMQAARSRYHGGRHFAELGRWLTKPKIQTRVARTPGSVPEPTDEMKHYGELEELKPLYHGSQVAETGTVWQHTADVAHYFPRQLSEQEWKALDSEWGGDVRQVMRHAIALHDIGKPLAIAAGNKERQHEFTDPLLRKHLKEAGLSDRDVELAAAVVGHDDIGEAVQKFTDKTLGEKAAANITKRAQSLGVSPAMLARLNLAFYHADAGSYPFVRYNYMHDDGGGRFALHKQDQIAPVLALINEPPRTAAVIKSLRRLPESRHHEIAEEELLDDHPTIGHQDIYAAKQAWHWRGGMSAKHRRILERLADTSYIEEPAIYRGLSFSTPQEAEAVVNEITSQPEYALGKRGLESFTTSYETARKYAEQPSAAVMPHKGVAAGHGVVIEFRANAKGRLRGIPMLGESEVLPPTGHPHKVVEVKHEVRDGFQQFHVVLQPTRS